MVYASLPPGPQVFVDVTKERNKMREDQMLKPNTQEQPW